MSSKHTGRVRDKQGSRTMRVCYLAVSKRQCTVQMAGCNFNCRGCFSPAKNSAGIQVSLQSLLEHVPPGRRLMLAGGEPTLQAEEMIELIDALPEHHIILSTNGSLLQKNLIKQLSGVEVHVDLKAITESIHQAYTGCSNKPVLNAIKELHASSMRFEVDTVLIPGVVEAEEIERIACFLAGIDRHIPLRIIRYVPANNFSRRPTYEELQKARSLAEKHLYNVTTSAEQRNHPRHSEKIIPR